MTHHKGPRDYGTEGPRGWRLTPASSHHSRARGFSLIEVLLAIFILGIGAISIAAIFPAGIVQQRQTVDDMLGPIVANNALEVLRSKLHQRDFGLFLDASGLPIADPAIPSSVKGDWAWRRPAFFMTGAVAPKGSISIFEEYPSSTRSEIPYNQVLYGADPPDFLFTIGERYYPQASVNIPAGLLDAAPKPEYVWDCMFRRFEGRVYVAIFVYRVALPNVGSFTYTGPPANPSDPTLPPIPLWIEFTTPARQWDAFGADNKAGTADDVILPGTDPGDLFDPSDHTQQWQLPGQWILDQNNNVHRIQFGREVENDPAGPVMLARPIPALPPLSVYSGGTASSAFLTGAENIVTDVWYLPRSFTETIGGVTYEIGVTPVYVMVREL